MQVCCSTLTPSVESLIPMFQSIPYLNYPDLPSVPGIRPFPSLPTLPTIGSPIFPGISIPSAEIPAFADEFQTQQLMTVVGTALSSIESVIGSQTLPTIPGTSLSLSNILAGQYTALETAINRALAINPSVYSAYLPAPLFPATFESPVIQAALTVKLVVKNWFSTFVNWISGLLSSVASKLKISAPSIPNLPSFATLQTNFMNAAGASTYSNWVTNFKGDFSSINSVNIAGISTSLSTSTFGNMLAAAIQIPIAMSIAAGDYAAGIVTQIISWVRSVIGGTFTQLCVSIS